MVRTYLKNILMMTKTETYSRKFLMIVRIYLIESIFDDAKDILEKVSYDCDDISEKVSDDAKDILEKVLDDGDIF